MSQSAHSRHLGQAFADPVLGSQRVFRAVLGAMAEPGRVFEIAGSIEAPPGLSPAAARILLTLADYETPVWLPPALGSEAAAYIRFHCGAPIVDAAEKARFAVLDAAAGAPALSAFDAGEDRYPDKSATVIVQCVSLVGGPEIRLEGPGIEASRVIAPPGLRPAFWDEAVANHARYPLGVDLLLVAGDVLLALPRTTLTTPILAQPETR